MVLRRISIAFLAVCLVVPTTAAPQDAPQPSGNESSSSSLQHRGQVLDPASGLWRPVTTEKTLLRNLMSDQISIWKSPFELKHHDLSWLLPFGAATAFLISGDQQVSKHFPGKSMNSINQSRSLSNYAAFAMAGTAGGAWAWGRVMHNDHARETGLLSGEAAIDSIVLNYGIKQLAGRQRPQEGNGNGRFFQGGASFPSEHSMFAWSIASVVGNEYPGRLPKLFAYGLASAVSLTRISGREHFPSDVVVGSALGWLTGQYVYRTHHDPSLPGAAWGKESAFDQADRMPRPRGATYVPLGSWVYAAFDRLAALGAIQTGYAGQRPWSRTECQSLLDEAQQLISADTTFPDEAQRLFEALQAEFSVDSSQEIGLDSVYVRGTQISGTPLNDGFHFGETLYNDYGRPYWTGFNSIAGATAHANVGPIFGYIQAEYQHTPSAPGYSQTVLQAIAAADATLVDPAGAVPAVHRVRLLESYIGARIGDWQFSFGKQNLWWGPSAAGPFLFSDNAEPPVMLRVSQQGPRKLPSLLGFLGPVKSEFFFGQLAGHRFIQNHLGQTVDPQPYIHGEKISFKPTPNLEMGFSKTTIFAGLGSPLTMRRLLSSYVTTGNCTTAACDPGDRRVGFDLSYRVPGLRKYLQVYTDSFSEDEPFPIAYPSRSAWNPGIYIAQIPKITKLDLRVEHLFTPTMRDPGFYYNNIVYRSGYTENGTLLGSWVGREGSSTLAWLRYWLSPQSTLEFTYRTAKVNPAFLQGGTLTDFGAKADLMVRRDTRVTARVQHETWDFPLLSTTQRSNLAASVEIVYEPKWLHRKSSGTQQQSQP